MRGKPEASERSIAALGITPAGAGKTTSVTVLRSVLKDHPRRCGENRNVIEFENRLPGSPPQVRGKHKQRQFFSARQRITPAGAGKTNTVAVTRTVKRDHPRRCGENYVAPCLFCKLKGSPPQVRGKRYTSGGGTQPARITPAGAGKTGTKKSPTLARKDHPRRCGEN